MKPGNLDLTTAPILLLEDVRTLTRVGNIADRGFEAGWLESCGKSSDGRSGQWIFTRRAVDQFIARIADGEFPPASKP